MDLATFLVNAGYQQVPLTFNGAGHFQTEGSLAGQSVAVLLDTGAASTVLSVETAEQLGLSLTKLDIRGGGAGGVNLEVFLVQEAILQLGSLVLRPRALMAMDLTYVNQALAMKGANPIEVVLGVDVFEGQSAVIDYASRSLFLRE